MTLKMVPCPPRPELDELIKAAVVRHAAMTPFERALSDAQGRRSWVVGEMGMTYPDKTREELLASYAQMTEGALLEHVERSMSRDAAVREAHLGLLRHYQAYMIDRNQGGKADADKRSLAYAAWFIDHALERGPELRLDKLARWIGFIQGVLAVNGVIEVDAERDRTRPIFQAAYAT